MTDYGKLMSSIWNDKKFVALNDREQKMYMMLFSFPTRNLAGVLPLTIRRWATCSADATVESVTESLGILVAQEFIIIDWDTEEVLIRTYIRNDEVYKQPNLMTRCLKFCEAVASSKLKAAVAIELKRIAAEHMPDEKAGQQKIKEDTRVMAKLLEETFGGTFDEGSMEPLFETFPDTIGEPPGVGGYVSSKGTPAPASPPSSTTSTGINPPAGDSQGALRDPVQTPAKRAHRLKEDWLPPQDVIDRMKVQYPTINLREEFKAFQNFHIGKGSTWVDWTRSWWTWVEKAAKEQGVSKGRAQRVATSDQRVAAIDAMREAPRLPTNQRLNALFSTDRKELTDGS